MAKIKFDTSAIPLNNEHNGYTFQRNNYGFSMFPAGRNARKRYERQWLRQHPNQKAVTQWRNMPQSVKDQWALFASTFPQPSNKDPNVFLNGFELFVKRNYFCFLNHGIHSDFMLEPEIVELPAGTIDFQLAWSEHAIDCTELYIKNFGILPQVGQYVILYAAIYAEYSGQFFTPVIKTIRVDEIYLDGLFCTVTVPDELESITISVYLSKIFHQSVQYAGTKARYMGCFTKKKFIELNDTPGSYAGNSGKIPKVNPAENGLIFESPAELSEAIRENKCGTVVYDENTEWTAGPTGSYFDFENEEEVFNKTKSIQVLNCPSNSVISFESGGKIATDTYAAVVLYIKLMAEMPSNLDVKLLFIYEDEHHSNQIALSINKTLLDEWQPLLVPLSLFTFDGPTFTGIQLFLTIDTGSAIFPEMYIDYIALMETEAEPDCTCFCLPDDKCEFCLPDNLSGNAGKFPAVNAAEDGYELQEGGGGGGTAPDTISSTTENTEAASLHTHALNEIISAKTNTYATVTVDTKGRVTALSSGVPPSSYARVFVAAHNIASGSSQIANELNVSQNAPFVSAHFSYSYWDSAGNLIDQFSGIVIHYTSAAVPDSVIYFIAPSTAYISNVIIKNVSGWKMSIAVELSGTMIAGTIRGIGFWNYY